MGPFEHMVPTTQGGHQAAGLCVAICFAIGGGIIVGKKPALEPKQNKKQTNTQTKKSMIYDWTARGDWLLLFPQGCILRLPIWGDPADDNCFNDESYWEVRDESDVPSKCPDTV